MLLFFVIEEKKNDIMCTKRVGEWVKPHNRVTIMWFKFAFDEN